MNQIIQKYENREKRLDTLPKLPIKNINSKLIKNTVSLISFYNVGLLRTYNQIKIRNYITRGVVMLRCTKTAK